MTYSNKRHPECGKDEVFLSNCDDESYVWIGWSTKRKGKVAYMRSGEEVGSKWPGSFPVFVSRDEIVRENPELLRRIESREDL